MTKTLSPAHRQAISDALRGVPKTPEHAEAISRAMHERAYVFTDEHRAKLRASRARRELAASLRDA